MRKVSPGRTGAVVFDLQSGRRLRAQPLAAAQPGVEREARNDLRGSHRPRALVPIETDVLGEGTQDGTTWQGDLVLKGYGDPTLSSAEVSALARQVPQTGSAASTGACWATSRGSTRGAPGRLEAGLLPPRVAAALRAHRRPRPDGTASEAARARRRSSSAATAARRRARHAGPRIGVATAEAARSLASVGAARGPRPVHGQLQRQLRRRDAAEGGRRRAGGAAPRLPGPRRSGAARAPACRSPGSGSSTAPGSRFSTAGRRGLASRLR